MFVSIQTERENPVLGRPTQPSETHSPAGVSVLPGRRQKTLLDCVSRRTGLDGPDNFGEVERLTCEIAVKVSSKEVRGCRDRPGTIS